MPVEIALGVALALYLIASLMLHCYGINAYVMIAIFLRGRRHEQRADRDVLARAERDLGEQDLPVITTQLPVYNEKHVVARLLQAVCAFDYPREKHEIQLLDDSTDETAEIAARVVKELCAAGHDVQHLRRTERTGYKAGALEAGLKPARGEFIAIFDADFVPPPDFLRRTVPFLLADPQCGFVQTRWGHRNRSYSMLTLLQSIGIDGHFAIEQPARCWGGLFFNFNGTAGVWRRQAIAAAGGWQPDTLTEDLDLSYRMMLAGWRARYLPGIVTPAEIPTDINALKSQQYRWAKGSMQSAVKLLPTVWRRPGLGLFKKIQATLHLTHYAIHPLILLVTILVVPLVWLFHLSLASVWIAPLVILMFLALFGPSTLYVVSQWSAGGSRCRTLLLMPVMMALGIGLAVNNTRAVISGLAGRRSEFVRTPKLGAGAEQREAGTWRPRAAYRLPRGRLWLLEILMGIWALTALLGSLRIAGPWAGPFLILQAAGFGGVGIATLVHARGRR